MPESDSEMREGGETGFDFDLAEIDFGESRTISDLALRNFGIEGSQAGYEAYDYTDDNKVPDSNPWTGTPNSFA